MTTPEEKRLKIDGRTVHVHMAPAAAPGAADERWAIVVCERPAAVVNVAVMLPDLAAALGSAGCATVRYDVDEPPAEHELTGEDLINEVLAVLDTVREQSGGGKARLGLLGVGPASILAASAADRASDLERVCLLAPTVPEDLAARRAKNNGQSSLVDPTRWSTDFLKSLASLEPVQSLSRFAGSVLIVQGAADRIIASSRAHPYLDALDDAGRPADHELIALGDERLDSDSIRAVYVRRIARFFTEAKSAKPAESPA